MSDKQESTSEDDVKSLGLHKVYIRHGHVDLVPLPSDSPEDPLNWPYWRKHVVLFLVSFHAFSAIFAAALIIPAYLDISQEFGVSLTRASYLTGVQILFLGVSPLLWAPLSARYGRRPLYLFSTISASACAFAGAFCHSYGALMTTRVFQSICISPPMAIGAATVKEMFFQHELGQKLGVWTLLVTIGPAVAPFIGGFIVQNVGWQWLFYLLAIVYLALFFGYVFFGFETLYIRPTRGSEDHQVVDAVTADSPHIPWWHHYVYFRRIDPRPIRALEFVYPLAMAARLPVLLCTISYAVTFGYSGILITVLVPQFFQVKFGLDDQQIGLQFISVIIGAILGEQLAGYGSDRLMRWRTKRADGAREPEMRLVASWPGFVLATVGIIVWGVQLQNATPGKWNVTPDIGSGIAYFGLQLVTTPLYVYCLESYPADAAAISAFISVVRQAFGFTIPFYVAGGAIAMGQAKEAGLLAAITGACIFPVWACELWGKTWREKTRLPANELS